MIFREALAEDAALISKTIAESWRGSYQGLIDNAYLNRLPDEYWLPSLRSWLESGRMYGYVAEADGMLVGSVIYGRGRDDQYADWGEIVSLYLLPQYAGRGIGTRLLQDAVASLYEDGYRRIYLWAIQGNEKADGFYRHQGFLPAEEHVDYKIGNQHVTDVMYIRKE